MANLPDVGKALRKLKSHPIHKKKPLLDLEQLATVLTTPEIVRQRFDHLLELGQDILLDIAEEDNGDLLHTMEFEAQHQRIKHETTRACHLPVKLSLRKLNMPTPSLVYSFADKLKFEFGPLHSAVVVGNILIEWGREGIVEPLPCGHFVTEFQADVTSLGEWSDRMGVIQTEMSLANRQNNTERKLDILCKSMEEKSAIINKLVDVIVDYNRNKEYGVFSCNCQDFARDALAALGIKKPVEFTGKLQERFKQFKMGKIEQEAELKTHENLDAYVKRKKDNLTKHDLEYLQCLYFNFHLPIMEKSPNPDAWVCGIPSCESAELDKLIREHQLAAATKKRSTPSRSNTVPTRRSPPISTRRSSNGGSNEHSQVQSPFTPHNTPHLQPCVNDCGFMGDTDKAGFCITCFNLERYAAEAKEREREQATVRPTQPIPQEQPVHPQVKKEKRVKCHTPGCEFYGTSETNFYCSKCFDPSKDPNRQASPTIYKQVVANPPPVIEEIRVECPTRGCQFYGTPQTNFYCTKCFDPSKAPRCMECQDYFASPEYGGLCHGCFMKKTEAESAPPAELQTFEQPKKQVDGSSPLQQVSDPPTDVHKCYECKTYFANEEYNGLCNGCFMFKTTLDTSAVTHHSEHKERASSPPTLLEKTHMPGYEQSLSQTKPSRRPYMPGYEQCQTQGCPHPRTETGYCDICNANDTPPLQPESSGYFTEDKKQSGCYLCTKYEPTDTNQVCAAHKEILLRQVDQRHRMTESSPLHRQRSTSESQYTPAARPATQQHDYTSLPQVHHRADQITSLPYVQTESDYETPKETCIQNGMGGSSTRESSHEICVTPGCLYKGYQELGKLCPLCYEDMYPERKVPDTLPLV